MRDDILVSPYRGNAIKAVKNSDGTVLLSGIGAIYDTDEGTERDYEGDYFVKSTFFSPRLARGDDDEFEATYFHGIAMRPEFKGLAEHDFTHPVTAKATDAGLLVSLILDSRDEYEAVIAEAADKGALGWSIGSSPHRFRKTEMAGGRSRIDRMPIVEIAVTERPMEPRTYAVPLKSLLKTMEGEGHQEFMRRVSDALRSQHGSRDSYLWPVETFDDYAIVEGEAGMFWNAPFEDGADGIRFSGRSEWTEVERVVTYDPVAKALRSYREELQLTNALRSGRLAFA